MGSVAMHVRELFAFVKASAVEVARGSRGYYRWLAFLTALVVLGGLAWAQQLMRGMTVTAMTDQVPWGAYIANFSFTVGLASAALVMVALAYIRHDERAAELVIVGQVMAIAALTMGMLFVVVDIGRPDRAWHLMPGLGRFNFPISMLSWDVVVLNGYLLLNFYLATYTLLARFRGRPIDKKKYRPVLGAAMVWAVSIHVVAAFLYCGLAGRPHWHAAVLAPRVVASAFGSGPAMLIIVLTVIRDRMNAPVRDETIGLLRGIVTAAVYANLFLLGAELFTELYGGSVHSAPLRYLLFGLHGHHLLVPYMWLSIVLDLFSATVFSLPGLFNRKRVLLTACGTTIVGMWIEKGMGHVIPGFIPSSLGEIVEYSPSLTETLVCAGVWAAGGLVLTLMLKVAIPVEFHGLRIDRPEAGGAS
ncbi:MAG: NrfD/PsrC family molybdoenzyme membrane anchor subunit [Polyangiales bacterium]